MMSPKKSLYVLHKEKTKDCFNCDLSKDRTNVVVAKGTFPCDILFIGEAPGDSEDIIGIPFVGPAGKLLHYIIRQSVPKEWKVAYTNLVCCIPKIDGEKREPTKEEIQACQPRLMEFIGIVVPKVIIAVGKLAGKHVPHYIPPPFNHENFHEIFHPAFILRAAEANRNLTIDRCTTTIQRAINQYKEKNNEG